MMQSSSISLARALALALMVAAVQPGTTTASDAKAQAVVDQMLAATGGADAPYRAKRIAFTFAVERDDKTVASRHHIWHPATGQHQISGTDKDGKAWTIDWNLQTRTGTGTLAGAAVEGEAHIKMLERAWGLWVNDTYWLLMPYKLRDPGVTLAVDGEATLADRVCDRIKVTFDRVGLTPGDTYWVFVDRHSHHVVRWEFVLEGQQPPPVAFDWNETKSFGPLSLSLRKEKVGGGQAIVFRDVEVE